MIVVQFGIRLQERLLMTFEDGRNKRVQHNALTLAIRNQISKEKNVRDVCIFVSIVIIEMSNRHLWRFILNRQLSRRKD